MVGSSRGGDVSSAGVASSQECQSSRALCSSSTVSIWISNQSGQLFPESPGFLHRKQSNWDFFLAVLMSIGTRFPGVGMLYAYD